MGNGRGDRAGEERHVLSLQLACGRLVEAVRKLNLRVNTARQLSLGRRRRNGMIKPSAGIGSSHVICSEDRSETLGGDGPCRVEL